VDVVTERELSRVDSHARILTFLNWMRCVALLKREKEIGKEGIVGERVRGLFGSGVSGFSIRHFTVHRS
jgi:hypothetical protein